MSKKTFLLEGNECDDFEIHSNIADILCEKISNLEDESECINIGLLGKWGSGKSFIIKKLKDNLENKKIKILKFDVWKFCGKSLERNILLQTDRQAFEGEYSYNDESLDQILNNNIRFYGRKKLTSKYIKNKICGILIMTIIMFFFCVLSNYIYNYLTSKSFVTEIKNTIMWIMFSGSLSVIFLQGLGKVVEDVFESMSFFWK